MRDDANSLRHPLRRADRGLTPGRALINRDCFGNRQAPQKGYGCTGSSGNLPPPSPPAEKATAREDQAGKASADDGTRDCGWHILAVREDETRGNSGGKTCNNKQRKVCKLFELNTAGEDRAARLCGCAIKTKLRVTAQRQSERSDQPPLSGPGGMLVQGRPFRQRGRRSRSAGSGALEAEWCANGLYCAFRTQNWYMPTKVDGFSISKSCQRARLVIVLSVGKRPRKFCSTLPGKWNPRKSS